MAQKASREATVAISDQSFRVCFSILGIVALRDRWKLESDDEVLVRIDEIAHKFQAGKLDFRVIADIIWGGLQENHPELTPEQTLKLLSAAGIAAVPPIMEAIFTTLAAAAPPQGARQTRPPKGKNGASVSTS